MQENSYKQLQSKLWFLNVQNIDLQGNKVAIIHNVLSYGDLADIRLLLEMYSFKDIKHTFISSPLNVYTKPGLNFIKNVLLGLESASIKEADYVKNLY